MYWNHIAAPALLRLIMGSCLSWLAASDLFRAALQREGRRPGHLSRDGPRSKGFPASWHGPVSSNRTA